MTVDTRRPLPRFRHDELPGAMYAPEPDRHVYLAPYIGAGTDADPFRPRGTDDTPGWSAIDLRPDAATSDSGHAIVVTPSRLPVRDEAHAVYLGDDPDLPLPTIVRQRVEDRSHVGRGDLPDRMRGNQCIVADLLTLMADDVDPIRPNVLRPERDKVLRIHLGGEVWWEKSVPAGGSTFSDDFNRADQLLSASPDWDSPERELEIVSQAVEVPFNSTHYSRATTDFTTDHFAQALATGAGGGNTGVLARCNVPSPDTHEEATFYMFRYSNGAVQLFKLLSGSFTLIQSVSGSGSTVVERIECEGSTIRGIRDGSTIFTETDTSITAGTRVGLRSTSSTTSWDDFEAGNLGAVGPVGPFLRTSGGFLRTASGILRPAT